MWIRIERLTAQGEDRFVWLMGADNLAQFPLWKGWRRIMGLTAIAVFDRSPYSHTALTSKVARAFEGARLTESRADRLIEIPPPVWTYIHFRPHPASSTAIRAAARDVKPNTTNTTKTESRS